MGEEMESPAESAEEQKIEDHPMFKAVEKGNFDAVQNYFEVEGLSLEMEDQHGMTALMHASWKGQTEITKYLLKQGNRA